VRIEYSEHKEVVSIMVVNIR